MVKYYTTKYSWCYKIDHIEIVKESDFSVWLVNGLRCKKISLDGAYHDTIESAQAFVLEKANRQIHNSLKQLNDSYKAKLRIKQG